MLLIEAPCILALPLTATIASSTIALPERPPRLSRPLFLNILPTFEMLARPTGGGMHVLWHDDSSSEVRSVSDHRN